MKYLVTLSILSMYLVACTAASSPGSKQCSSNGVCIKIKLAEPIRLNEPTTVTTTITSDKDFSQVQIAIASDAPGLLIEDKQTWQEGTQGEKIDIKANRPIDVSRRILMRKEGRFNVIVSAMASTFRVEDSVYVIITKDNGKVYEPGQPIPTAPFRRLPTLPPNERLKGPLTPPSALGTAAPPLGRITPALPTARPPTRAPIPPTPTSRAYP